MTAQSPEKMLIDLNDLFPAKAGVSEVQAKAASWDVTPYRDRSVQIRGCSPTWAHLIVAGRLFGTARSVDFLLDDGKGGVSVPVYRRD